MSTSCNFIELFVNKYRNRQFAKYMVQNKFIIIKSGIFTLWVI